MKRMSFGGVVMMGLFLGCATAAPPPQASGSTAQGLEKDQAATATAKKDSDKTLICEDVPMTGSHIPRKVCRTKRQVDQEREQAQKAVHDSERVNREMGK